MIPGEYNPLIAKLISRTNTHDVKWESTSDQSSFEAQIGNNSLFITRRESYDPDMDEDIIYFEISIHHLDHEIDSFCIWPQESQDTFNRISNLFSNARRQALDIDRTIAEMLADLD